MNGKIGDFLAVGGLGAGAAYLNFVSTYGAAIVTTLAILAGVIVLGLRGYELWAKIKEARNGSK